MAGVAQRELITKTNLVAVPSSVFGGSDRGRSARASTAAASARSGRGTAKGKPKAPKFESRKTVEGVSRWGGAHSISHTLSVFLSLARTRPLSLISLSRARLKLAA